MTYQDQNRERDDEYEAGTFSLAAVPLEPETRNDDGDRATMFYGRDVVGNNEMRSRFGMEPVPTDGELNAHWVLPRGPIERLPAAGPTMDTPKARRI